MAFKSRVIKNEQADISTKSESFPESFEEWLDHNCIMSPIKHIERKYNEDNSSNLYLSDLLRVGSVYGKALSLKHADPAEPIFISAPTGCGKNYFAEHELLVPMLENNKLRPAGEHERILLLSNRVALNRQRKQDIAKLIRKYAGNSDYYNYIDGIKDEAQDIVDGLHDFGNILIYSYHQISSIPDDISDYNIRYVIFDECHFFSSDSVFNPGTYKILDKLISMFSNTVRIYMSSTMETVFEPIIRLEVDLYQQKLHDNCDRRLRLQYYDVSREYDYLNIRVWKDQKDIIDKIQSGNDGKWLIFVASKAEGEKLKDDLNNTLGVSSSSNDDNDDLDDDTEKSDNEDFKPAEFITGDGKSSPVYLHIVRNEKLPQAVKVLISTSVIDNGVNIKDPAVRNIVINMPDRVELIQMLGRLRVANDSENTINLYLKEYSKRELKKIWRNDTLRLLDRLEYQKAKTIPQDEKPKMLDIIDSEINPLSIYQLLSRIEDVSRMFESLPAVEIEKDSNVNNLILNKSDGDRQLKVLDWMLYDNPYKNHLSRRICNVLKEVKRDLFQPDTEKDGVIYRHPKFNFSEKSFLQIIQEKRASALEYDAISFIEKVIDKNYSAAAKEERLKELFKVNVDRYVYSKPVSEWQVAVNAYNNQVSGYGFDNDQAAKYEYFKNKLPDHLTDRPWNDTDIWNKLKKAQLIYEGKQELPDAAYMESKYEQYQELAKNDISRSDISPVILEQLHWLDMTSMPPVPEYDDADTAPQEDNSTVDTSNAALTKEQVDELLRKYTIPEEEYNKNKENSDWVKQNGYFLPDLKKIAKGDTSCLMKNGMSSADLRKLLVFFQDYFYSKMKMDTYKKLMNRLENTGYSFDYKDEKYSFKIMNIEATSHAIYYIFCRKPINSESKK